MCFYANVLLEIKIRNISFAFLLIMKLKAHIPTLKGCRNIPFIPYPGTCNKCCLQGGKTI